MFPDLTDGKLAGCCCVNMPSTEVCETTITFRGTAQGQGWRVDGRRADKSKYAGAQGIANFRAISVMANRPRL